MPAGQSTTAPVVQHLEPNARTRIVVWDLHSREFWRTSGSLRDYFQSILLKSPPGLEHKIWNIYLEITEVLTHQGSRNETLQGNQSIQPTRHLGTKLCTTCRSRTAETTQTMNMHTCYFAGTCNHDVTTGGNTELRLQPNSVTLHRRGSLVTSPPCGAV